MSLADISLISQKRVKDLIYPIKTSKRKNQAEGDVRSLMKIIVNRISPPTSDGTRNQFLILRCLETRQLEMHGTHKMKCRVSNVKTQLTNQMKQSITMKHSSLDVLK